ncbi:hypothetical protein IEO21_10770 [Rhodonia placenta]|uniref:Uncharacterized protein n=1 Tax=Rhodonia placenta TaxID=104341 RepID=A0A8H7NRV7_9APHY|nr:hypothetical protein IEO21_10770 [Postia placenta]
MRRPRTWVGYRDMTH